jgi:hypothetical protein
VGVSFLVISILLGLLFGPMGSVSFLASFQIVTAGSCLIIITTVLSTSRTHPKAYTKQNVISFKRHTHNVQRRGSLTVGITMIRFDR